MKDVKSLLKRVKERVEKHGNLECVSVNITISSEDTSYEYGDGSRLVHNGHLKYKSVNPEDGQEYIASDFIEELDEEDLIKRINAAQRNTVKKINAEPIAV